MTRLNVETRAIVLTVIAAALAVVPLTANQVEPPRPGDWTFEQGGQASYDAGVLTVRRGAVRTTRIYSDFVIGFEFQLTEPTAEGFVFVRSLFNYGGRAREHGYRLSLSARTEGVRAVGRLSGAGVPLKETTVSQARLNMTAGDWQVMEVRLYRGEIAVRVNGDIVSSAENLNEFAGYIALQMTRGSGIRFRNMRVERLPSASEPYGRGAYSAAEPGLTLPRVRKEFKPFYPKAPHDAMIQGVVALEVVVETNGRPGDIRVTKPVHPDLDEAAIAAARAWEFVPGTLSGRPVPVIVSMELGFRRTQ
jgi:TonB family protein